MLQCWITVFSSGHPARSFGRGARVEHCKNAKKCSRRTVKKLLNSQAACEYVVNNFAKRRRSVERFEKLSRTGNEILAF
jgi:hypothetical protein